MQACRTSLGRPHFRQFPKEIPNRQSKRQKIQTIGENSLSASFKENNLTDVLFSSIPLLRKSGQKRDLSETQRIHNLLESEGFLSSSNTLLTNSLINAYLKCQCLGNARKVFDKVSSRNVVTWTAIIAAYSQLGFGEEALNLFCRMTWEDGVVPNQFTYSSVLPALGSLGDASLGRQIHSEILKRGFSRNVFVGSGLISMYCKCRCLATAKQVFEEMPERNRITWNVMIAGFIQNNELGIARKLIGEMPQPDKVVWTTLVTAYLEKQQAAEALDLFKRMPERDVISWMAMIAGCSKNGNYGMALDMFKEMVVLGFRPNSETFANVLHACARLGASEYGAEIHGNVIRSRFLNDVFVGTALVDFYVNCRRIEVAARVYHRMPERNVASSNCLLVGYCQSGDMDLALKLFQSMPDRNSVTWNAMISGYGRQGMVDLALSMFQMMPARDAVSWSAMISCLLQNGRLAEGLKLFHQMPDKDLFSWNAVIAGITQAGKAEEAMAFFIKMPERNTVSWNTMIAGFVQNMQVENALQVFREASPKNVISWTAMIAGCTQNGRFALALELFKEMQSTTVKPNSATLASVLPASANLSMLNFGKQIHAYVYREGFHNDIYVGSALIDMYAKCGNLDTARKVFSSIPTKDLALWNAMIFAYANHGHESQAFNLFDQMLKSGNNPDHITFVGLLSACCHAGLVTQGLHYFDLMKNLYQIVPRMEHCCCIVDLLGRAGRLAEAEKFINGMLVKPSDSVLLSLLDAYRNHNSVRFQANGMGFSWLGN